MKAQFITAQEIQKVMNISRSKSYQIVRDLNKELKGMGYITIAGKCPIQFLSLIHILPHRQGGRQGGPGLHPGRDPQRRDRQDHRLLRANPGLLRAQAAPPAL